MHGVLAERKLTSEISDGAFGCDVERDHSHDASQTNTIARVSISS